MEIDLNIAADGPAELLKPLPERLGAELPRRIVLGVEHQHADSAHSLALLCAQRQRPRRRRAAEQRDELPSFLIELHPIPTSWDRTRQNIELARISQEVTERFYNLLAVGEGG